MTSSPTSLSSRRASACRSPVRHGRRERRKCGFSAGYAQVWSRPGGRIGPTPMLERLRGPARVLDPSPAAAGIWRGCARPARSPVPGDEGVRLDQGACIQCGRCVTERPDVFGWAEGPGPVSLSRGGLVVPQLPESDENLARYVLTCDSAPAPCGDPCTSGMWTLGRTEPRSGRYRPCSIPSMTCTGSGSFSPRAHGTRTCSLSPVRARAAWRHRFAVRMRPCPNRRLVIAAGSDAISGGLLAASVAYPTAASGIWSRWMSGCLARRRARSACCTRCCLRSAG